jgi:hypothetical protein
MTDVLTVRDLITRLQAFNPDLPVVVDCESRCDPHPVFEALLQGTSEGRVPHVLLMQDERADFETRTFNPEED